MPAARSRQSVLVKVRRGPISGRIAFGAGPAIRVTLTPLFESIRPTRRRGAAAPAEWHVLAADRDEAEAAPWDLCHALLDGGLGLAGAPPIEAAEPDVEQQWTWGDTRRGPGFAAAGCDAPDPPATGLPTGSVRYWFRDGDHSQLEPAREHVGDPAGERVRIAHLDTGYDRNHVTIPRHLRADLQRSFVDGDDLFDATDDSEGFFNQLGHGTGTIGILAGDAFEQGPLGGAPYMEVVPIRVANSVVLFKNSAIARAFDYVHELHATASRRVDVVTLSMGGLASNAWAEAVNALYEAGVFIVAAAGNNYGNLPTREIVFPARFHRVVAACGVMADGRPYADLGLTTMAGNYGPASKMATALAAFTPNAPWPRFGCRDIVDLNGAGTSSATPQVAAAAALWIQKHRAAWQAYPQGWMRVEAVRKALFESARTGAGIDPVRLGRGTLRARAALDRAPAPASALARAPEDRGSFPILRLLLGLPAAPGPRDAMLELEALQLSQRSAEVAALVPEPWAPPAALSAADRRRLIEALVEAPGVSRALRAALGDRDRAEAPTVAVPPSPSEAGGPDAIGDRQAAHAIAPALGRPVARRLRVYAYDPLMGTSLATSHLNEATLSVRWEPDLQPGPIGEYLEVVDVDPASEAAYAPVDLDHPHLLSQDGLKPSEGVPQFHQQMVYAVAMKTIEHFERALGRVALWAPHPTGEGRRRRDHFVRRLRIYPHALRERNAYYSPDRKALLFGYFNAPATAAGSNLPGGLVFTCLSHDIVAHETTHALLDGLHRRYREPSNVDVLAFHEAFADVVALFQHFTVPEALRDQIARTSGDLGRQNLLAQLARQFGEASGHHGALRDAIATYDVQAKQWRPRDPTPEDYHSHDEPHDRGAVLVAAVFDAFLQIYRRRSVDLVRLASGGTGVLPAGQIAPDLVERLAREAAKAAGHVLNMCIRALDYCPPVDVTFGDYLRALITADRDLVPDDPMGYRIAFISAFRARGIFPSGVRSLAADSLAWEGPAVDTSRLDKLPPLIGRWDRRADRAVVFRDSRADAATLHRWLMADAQKPMREACGLLPKGPHPIAVEQRRADGTVDKRTLAGTLTSPEIHSVRPARRIGPDGDIRSDLVVEITQSWIPGDQPDIRHRGGATVLIDLDSHAVRFVIRKRVAHPQRVGERWQLAVTGGHALRRTYFTDRKRRGDRGEPFAMIHRRL